ncbi:uncharacterized protein LOC112880830 [Panicum hallii]|uniref:uncharacterized protein LOC112880830 n=1 Tax=Panicum hallii TaxID=206008 RepID=UPI000DF4CCC7|nr:uncharacterized protein LOC112880830 [Panicum hallii]
MANNLEAGSSTGGSNAMTFINAIPPLDGSNYGMWAQKLEVALALSDIDFAITSPFPVCPAELVRDPEETTAAWQARQREHASVQMKFDLEKAKWISSNRKCLMVIKSSIIDSIRGAIPDCATAVEYLKKVESQFVGSSKAYAQTLIQRLVNDKYTGGGVREHILKMSNMQYHEY